MLVVVCRGSCVVGILGLFRLGVLCVVLFLSRFFGVLPSLVLLFVVVWLIVVWWCSMVVFVFGSGSLYIGWFW